MTPKKYYMGNTPNSSVYDPNVPIGWNQWDAEEIEENEPEEEIPDEETGLDTPID